MLSADTYNLWFAPLRVCAHDPNALVLEVANEAGNSTLWDELFDTDQDALTAFEQVIIEEGMETFLDGNDIETLH